MVQHERDPQDRERMLTFATRWMQYGGGAAEDIMATFGTTPDVYFRRLQGLLKDTERPVGLDSATIAALDHMCWRRLQLASTLRDRIAAPQ